MPPELNIRRFKGLRYYYPKSEKANDELSQAKNVMFDREGVLIQRPSFDRLGAVTPGANGTGTALNTGDPLVMWASPANDTLYMVFQKSDRLWMSQGQTNAFFEASGVTMGANEAVVYDGNIYFPNGTWWNGAALAAHPGMPTGRESIIIHKDRCFVTTRNNDITGTDPYRVYFSEPGVPAAGAWPAANFIDVRTGSPNRALISYRDQVYIFKPDSVHVLSTGGLPANWTLRRLGDRGCVGGPCVYNNVLYWIGQTGVFSYNGVSINRISDPIQKFFDENPISYDDTCQIVGFDGDLYIQCKLETGVRVFWLFNIKQQAWTEWIPPFGDKTGRMLVIEDRIGVTTENWTRGVYLGTGESATMKALHRPYVFKLNPTMFQDQDETNALFDFTYTVETAQLDFDEPHRKKRAGPLTVEGMFDHLTVDQFDEDGRTKQKVWASGSFDQSKVQMLKIPGIGYFRSMRVKLSGLANPGGLKLHGLRAEVKQKGRQIEQQPLGTYANQP